jgi:acyl-CoA synthetase (NDP forming)
MTPGQRENLKRLLAPRHAAFIGGDSAAAAIAQCVAGGFAGEIWGVNPRRNELGGRPCYGRVEDLPQAPDAVFLAVPVDGAIDTVAALAAIGAGGIVGYTAGFSETGAEGASLEERLVAAAGDMALIGPNCSGILSYAHKAALWPFDHSGHGDGRGVSFITQSGMLGNTLTMNQRSVPLAYVISSGNQAMLGVEDVLDVLIEDPKVSAVGLYIEGLRDIPRFADVAARALERNIPIVAFKAGSSQIGSQLTVTHTGSLSGDDELYSALFARSGVVRVDSPVVMLETLKMITVAGAPKGRRLAALTCSGGDSAMVADAAEKLGLILAQPTPEVARKLEALLPSIATVANPLDYTTPLWGHEDAVTQTIAALLEDGFDAALMVQDYPIHNPGPSYDPYLADARAFTKASKAAMIPAAICSVLPDNIDPQTRATMIENGIAPLQGVNEALAAIAGAAVFGERRTGRAGEETLRLAPLPKPIDKSRTLDEWQGKRLLAEAGITVPNGRLTTAAEAPDAAQELGFPVAVKLVSAALPHKTEAGALRLGVTDSAGVAAACADIQNSVRDFSPEAATDSFLVECMVEDPVAEIIVGISRNDQFGLVMVLGSGGVLVELVRDAKSLLFPISRDEVSTSLDGLRVSALIAGYRGRPPGDREACIDAILQIAHFAESNRDVLAGLDVNPLMVLPSEAVAADVLLQMSV